MASEDDLPQRSQTTDGRSAMEIAEAEEIAEAARRADALRREAGLLREKASQLDDDAARIEAHFGQEINPMPNETTQADRPPDGPAVLANRVWVSWSDGIVKLTFAEQDGPDRPAVHRAAVAITAHTVDELCKIFSMLPPGKEDQHGPE